MKFFIFDSNYAIITVLVVSDKENCQFKYIKKLIYLLFLFFPIILLYMMNIHTFILYILILLIFCVLINYLRLIYTKQPEQKSNYFTNCNFNKWPHLETITYSYIYPKIWKPDRCFMENCSTNGNLIEEKIKAFHNELTSLSNNKVAIIKNNFNTAPYVMSLEEKTFLSNINKSIEHNNQSKL